MDESVGINSRGEYESGIDPRFDYSKAYAIPEEEFEGWEYQVQAAPIPATPSDILVDLLSEEFLDKNMAKLIYQTRQLRLNYETGKVHPCVYIPEYEA